MKYEPVIVDGHLVCTKCKNKNNKNLVFHHIHSTGEIIAIICTSCNPRLGQESDLKEASLNKSRIEGSYEKPQPVVYVPPKYAWIFEKFTLEELDILLKDGTSLFEYMAETPKSKTLLEFNKRLAAVIEKW